VLVEIVKGDGDTVVAGEVIARIDTEAQAGTVLWLRPKKGRAAPVRSAAVASGRPAGVAMPAARKILEEKGVAAPTWRVRVVVVG
jgi:2-oxoglutarate dehydrogenase E2 component (dihydrolipoamide succinyltransferase)